MPETHETYVAGGHKANIANPTTSVESKQHSEHVLKDEFGVQGMSQSPHNVLTIY